MLAQFEGKSDSESESEAHPRKQSWFLTFVCVYGSSTQSSSLLPLGLFKSGGQMTLGLTLGLKCLNFFNSKAPSPCWIVPWSGLNHGGLVELGSAPSDGLVLVG